MKNNILQCNPLANHQYDSPCGCYIRDKPIDKYRWQETRTGRSYSTWHMHISMTPTKQGMYKQEAHLQHLIIGHDRCVGSWLTSLPSCHAWSWSHNVANKARTSLILSLKFPSSRLFHYSSVFAQSCVYMHQGKHKMFKLIFSANYDVIKIITSGLRVKIELRHETLQRSFQPCSDKLEVN